MKNEIRLKTELKLKLIMTRAYQIYLKFSLQEQLIKTNE